MGKMSANSDIANVKDVDDFKRFVQVFLDQVKGVINGGIDLDNLKGSLVSVVFLSANQDTQVQHNLGVIPRGYLKISGPNVAVFDGGAASTTENIFLQASGAATCSVLVLG